MSIKSFIFLILGLTKSFFNRSQLKSPAMIISLLLSSVFQIFLNIVETLYLNLVGGTRFKLRLVYFSVS